MNPFDYAMQVEKVGEALYGDFAGTASDEGLVTIFTELADQENTHYEIFKKMKDRDETVSCPAVDLTNINSIFNSWKKDKDKFNFKISQAEAYQKALRIEQLSIAFYLERADEAKNTMEKGIFTKIADEERRHYDIVDNIIEFITQPERWVEHAEFSKIGEVY